jgi:hypothetical protein
MANLRLRGIPCRLLAAVAIIAGLFLVLSDLPPTKGSENSMVPVPATVRKPFDATYESPSASNVAVAAISSHTHTERGVATSSSTAAPLSSTATSSITVVPSLAPDVSSTSPASLPASASTTAAPATTPAPTAPTSPRQQVLLEQDFNAFAASAPRGGGPVTTIGAGVSMSPLRWRAYADSLACWSKLGRWVRTAGSSPNATATDEWEFVPPPCPVAYPRITHQAFCSAVASKRIFIAGDSISGEFYNALLAAAYRYRCNNTVAALAFVRNDHLNLSTTEYHFDGRRNVWAEPMGPVLLQFQPTHLILNRGAHFVPDAVYEEGLRGTILQLQQQQVTQHAMVLLRTTPQGHPNCAEHTVPLAAPIPMTRPLFNWEHFPRQNGIMANISREVRCPLLDTATPLLLRPDHHLHPTDCLHYTDPSTSSATANGVRLAIAAIALADAMNEPSATSPYVDIKLECEFDNASGTGSRNHGATKVLVRHCRAKAVVCAGSVSASALRTMTRPLTNRLARPSDSNHCCQAVACCSRACSACW